MTDRTCIIEGCCKPHFGRGWCQMHYRRWTQHGDPLGASFVWPDSFWSKVDKSGECWIWTGAITKRDGYGRSADGSGGGRIGVSHRISYELVKGPIPEGLHIDHICRVRACVNPDHLEAVTQAENNRRAGCDRRGVPR